MSQAVVSGFPLATDGQFNRKVVVALSGPWDNATSAWTAGPPTNYLNVAVTIEWWDAGGDAQALQINTILTDY